MIRKFSLAFFPFALALAMTIGLSGCSSEQPHVLAAPEIMRNVSVATVLRSEVPDLLEAVGTVRAEETSQLASQTGGNIVEVRVHEGDRVNRGQLLAIIDDA